MPTPSATKSSTQLSSLEALEQELEESFTHLKRKLHAVYDEVRQLPERAAGGPLKKSPAHLTGSVDLQRQLSENSSVPASPKIQDLKLRSAASLGQDANAEALEVPQQLKQVANMGTGMKHVGIAAARARASGQPKDLVSKGSGEDVVIRLHPRWMELATKSDQGSARLSSKKSIMRRKERSQRVITVSEFSDQALQISGTAKLLQGRLPGAVHPHSPFRLVWDMIGLTLIMLDAFLLPLSLAWDLPLLPSSIGGGLLFTAFWVALIYWCTDIFMSSNTGIYENGRLVLARQKIICNYVQTWLLFDLVLVFIDLATAYSQFVGSDDSGSGTAVLRGIRSFRILRGMRLLRLVKMSKLSTVIEEASVAAGRQWLVLVVAILKTVFVVMISAHGLACFWYLIGRLREDDGRVSWLSRADVVDVGMFGQYLHAFQWVLTTPAPLPVEPDSAAERLYCILIVGMTVVVIGGSLSKITGTLAEIRTINSEGSRKRREVRQYLHAQHVSMELTSRILRFVDYKLERQSSVSLDQSLISPSLHIELHVSQRGGVIEPVPIFNLTKELFPEVFAAICGALEKHVYGKQEYVFVADSWAHAMHITSIGNFVLTEDTMDFGDGDDTNDVITGVHWFSEAALFAEALVHELSLRADTFGESFSLTGDALAQCLSNSPPCTAMLCEYAKELLSLSKKHASKTWLEDASRKACESNSFYLEVHPDPKTLLENISMDPHVRLEHDGEGETDESGSPKLIDVHLDPKEIQEPEPSPGGLLAAELAQQVLDVHMKKDTQEELLAKMRMVFPELHPERGSHTLLSQAGEREKSESCCLSIIALATDSFVDFTAPQAEAVQLKQAQWNQLRQLVQWTEVDATKLHAVMVLLAIRSLGKSKRVTQQLPSHAQRPEQALIYVMQNQVNVVPSVTSLREEEFNLVCNVLEVHMEFNLAQMLQGENIAASVFHLQAMIREKGVDVFKFYILFLLGFMSGLAGGTGSRFMNARNSTAVIHGIECLLHVLDSSPQAVYWSFVISRAKHLKLPDDSPEDIALVRLACLSRVQDKFGFLQLRMSWELLGMREREVLVSHFLADGINEQALVFEFLPDCMAKAKENKYVSVHVLLEVLVDLIEDLRQLDASKMMVQPSPRSGQTKVITIDLADMAEFISTVQNRFVFQTCVSKCKIRFANNRGYLTMTGDNWGRTHEPENDTTMLAYSVKELLQRQKFLHELVAQSSSTMSSGGEAAMSHYG